MAEGKSKRPDVRVRATSAHGSWPGSKQAVVWCMTKVEQTGVAVDCDYTYVAAVKVDAEDNAKRYRQWHRDNPGTTWAERQAEWTAS